MRSMKLILPTLVSVILLSGCGVLPFNDLKAKEDQVKEYNKMVLDTLGSYAQLKVLADTEKEKMLNMMTQDKDWALALKSSVFLDPLTAEELKAFKTYGVVYDDYYTSLGATALREVVILTGGGHQMYVTIIWDKDKVHSISRVVKKV